MRHSRILWIILAAIFSAHALPLATTPRHWAFALMVVITQASLLTLPLLLLERALARPRSGPQSRARRLLPELILTLVAATTLVLVYSNYTLHKLFGFYIDPFVINILTTPGGIEALGASSSFYLSAIGTAALIVLAYAALVAVLSATRLVRPAPRRRLALVSAVFALFLVQSVIYAVAEYQVDSRVLVIADSVPWYPEVTAKSTLANLGVARPHEQVSLEDLPDTARSRLASDPELALPLQHRYNVVWLVAESWRWDMLTPDIMPETARFAANAHRFSNHYSSGNGTRMGIFGQFYGLPGQLWFPALRYGVAPPLLDVLQASGYEVHARTSASFSYPEFDKTVWLNVPQEQLVSDHEGARWERDRRNVSGLIDFMRNASSPFMAFMFFESTHANYDFPPENAIRSAYIEDFNYLEGMPASSMPLVKNRYINASNHLDSQLARVFNYLAENALLDNTIVIVTGDHGEEFMESGHWGHNSTFSRQQIRVPLIIHVPGQDAAVHSQMTSHLDIPATLLNRLRPGVDRQLTGVGSDLLAENYDRSYAVVSDWHGDALVADHYVLSLSAKANARGASLSDEDGKPHPGGDLPEVLRAALGDYMATLGRFGSRGS